MLAGVYGMKNICFWDNHRHCRYAIIMVFPCLLGILIQFDDDDSLDDEILASSVADLPDTAQGSGLQVKSPCFYCTGYKVESHLFIGSKTDLVNELHN
jgi:hypothetical protein